ncbi:MAG: geranylgeranyl diphosphate reductase [Polyangiaceae bacterium]|jgi:geranylgeranyl reductase|nr:geranylgeranyl diphosphate reductase [Polyangiaceae bacterium]
MMNKEFDVVVVGGGPAGATAANDLARAGFSVLLLDKAGRTKPCGGAIPPRLIRDFDIPDRLICAKIRSARMVAPSRREVDMPIDGGFVGMVDRDVFDEFLRERAAASGAVRVTGSFDQITREEGVAGAIVHFQTRHGATSVRARLVIGADGALSRVARQEIDPEGPRYVFAYHEIVKAPSSAENPAHDGTRCDVVYDGATSPDFYGWVFPHGGTVSVGVGSAQKGFNIKNATAELRARAGLATVETVRREGAPIPMKPLDRWDNGRDVLLAGDAAGVVAPASGEGIYYAMVGGQLAAVAAAEFLVTGKAQALRRARKMFMKAHGRVFWILGVMQYFWYSSDKRRERFVTMCKDPDVQSLTWEAYMNKELVRARPAAHLRIFLRDMAHLLGFASPT